MLNRVLNLNSKENMTKAEIMAIVVGTRLVYEIHLKDYKITYGLLVAMWQKVSNININGINKVQNSPTAGANTLKNTAKCTNIIITQRRQR